MYEVNTEHEGKALQRKVDTIGIGFSVKQIGPADGSDTFGQYLLWQTWMSLSD